MSGSRTSNGPKKRVYRLLMEPLVMMRAELFVLTVIVSPLAVMVYWGPMQRKTNVGCAVEMDQHVKR